MIKDGMKRHNKEFIEGKKYEEFQASKYPRKKAAIVTCMDTRLVELLPKALGIKNGDVTLISIAGGLVVDPYSDAMRSLLISVYELGVEEIFIIAHTNCGVEGLQPDHFYKLMEARGVSADKISEERIRIINRGKDLDIWLTGFDDLKEAVSESVDVVKEHPLMPEGIKVYGYVMETSTGELITVEE